jgi:hypothetical protein
MYFFGLQNTAESGDLVIHVMSVLSDAGGKHTGMLL